MSRIVLHLSDGRKMELPNPWDGVRECWEWDYLMDCMSQGAAYYASDSLVINTAQIVTAECREADE